MLRSSARLLRHPRSMIRFLWCSPRHRKGTWSSGRDTVIDMLGQFFIAELSSIGVSLESCRIRFLTIEHIWYHALLQAFSAFGVGGGSVSTTSSWKSRRTKSQTLLTASSHHITFARSLASTYERPGNKVVRHILQTALRKRTYAAENAPMPVPHPRREPSALGVQSSTLIIECCVFSAVPILLYYTILDTSSYQWSWCHVLFPTD